MKRKISKKRKIAYFFAFLAIAIFIASLVALYYWGTWFFIIGVVAFIASLVLMDKFDRD